MKVFDHIDALEIDRREIHLRMLAFTVIMVLVLGLALMMYPSVFSKPMTLSGSTFQTVFFSFCTLSILLVGYLFDRHLLITRLRKRILAKENAIEIMQQEASKDFLASLPTVDTFTDRLAMEFRRVSRVEQPLSLIAVEIKLRPEICNPTENAIVLADAGRAILRKIRGDDSLFLLDSGVFAILLPRISTHTAELMKSGFEAELRETAGLEPRFSFNVLLTNYPDQSSSAHEMMENIHPVFAVHPDRPALWNAMVPATLRQ
jgi:GGDEF domain-containing protein